MEAVGQYGYANDHSAVCDKRWIRIRSGRGECGRCSSFESGHLEDNTVGEEAEEEAGVNSEEGDEGQPRHVKGSQRWRNVKAVMAYYYALRKIKRNVAFVFEANHFLACHSMVLSCWCQLLIVVFVVGTSSLSHSCIEHVVMRFVMSNTETKEIFVVSVLPLQPTQHPPAEGKSGSLVNW